MTESWPPATVLADEVRAGTRSALDAAEAALAAVDRADGELGAFVVLDPDGAREAAAAVDAAVARGEDPGPLAGVPIGVKDLEDCAGLPTSHGSLLYQGRAPVPADSIHVARLRAAGAIPIGKTAAPEFGTLSWTRSKAWGTARNPNGFVEVETTALETLVGTVSGYFDSVRSEIDRHMTTVQSLDWAGNAQQKAIEMAQTMTAALKTSANGGQTSITEFINKQKATVEEADV